MGFDILEISSGFITIPVDDWLRLVEKVRKAGLKPKPEVGIQFGAGGATAAAELEAEGTRDSRPSRKLVSSLAREEPAPPGSLRQRAHAMWIGPLARPGDFWMPGPI